MNSKIKRIVSGLLALQMAVQLVPVQVFALRTEPGDEIFVQEIATAEDDDATDKPFDITFEEEILEDEKEEVPAVEEDEKEEALPEEVPIQPEEEEEAELPEAPRTEEEAEPTEEIPEGEEIIEEADTEETFEEDLSEEEETIVEVPQYNFEAVEKGQKRTESVKLLGNVSISSAVCFEDGVKVTWKTLKGAQFYQVMYKTVGGEWTYCQPTDSLTYTVHGLESGVKYVFTVRACDETGSAMGTFSTSGKSCIFLTEPQTQPHRAVSDTSM